jgi:glycosyltransferase involved in cell wall biosynthesis
MKILLIHQNFPGQFKHLAPALVKQGHQVVAFILRDDAPKEWSGVRLVPYKVHRGSTPNIHPWIIDIETKVIRGEALFRAALKLKADGFNPDVIIAHPGWGESLFIKNVWADAKLAMYCEFFYKAEGGDVGFDPEFPSNPLDDDCRLQMKNVNNLLHFEIADAGISPTHWQASTFPDRFRDKIAVIHDGIDTESLRPNPAVSLSLNKQITLTRNDEIITFVSRTLEPYRGYHVFMRALPELLAKRPKARILIVGTDQGASYGAAPPKGQTWRSIFFNEVKHLIKPEDLQRIHFLGRIEYEHFIPVLQLSTVHVYLTYPFVLSWSLLESMSVGCAIVASNTQPLHEAIIHNETGRLVEFFDHAALAREVCDLLDNPAERVRLGANARQFAQQHYDLKTICLPQQLNWVNQLPSV